VSDQAEVDKNAAEVAEWERRSNEAREVVVAREKKFIALFPELLRLLETKDRGEPIGWNGIETPTSWDDTVVIPMFTEMNELLRPLNLDKEDWPAVAQLKSKFASLRCYMNIGRIPEEVGRKIGDIVEKYERVSTVTSELSGKPGELFNSAGWWIILTPDEIKECVEEAAKGAQQEWADPSCGHAPEAVVHYKTKRGVQCVGTLYSSAHVAAWQNAETQAANDVSLIKIWVKPEKTKSENPQGTQP
jgi:hypothetical protein